MTCVAVAAHCVVGSPPQRGTSACWHAEVIEHARDDEVHEIVDRRRPVIEARRRRHHDRAGARHAQHVLEMDRAERRLARHEHQRAPLLERDVGRALDERARRARGDRATASPSSTGQITMPALSAEPDAGAAPRSLSSNTVTNASHAAAPTRVAQRLDRCRCRSPSQQPQSVARHDELHRSLRRDERLEQPHGVRRARRAGDRDDDRPVASSQPHAMQRVRAPIACDEPLGRARRRRTTMLITPFIVKNAASSCEKSSGFTSECS